MCRQRTLKRKASFSGVGVHSGKAVDMTIGPAAPDSGFSFVRTDRSGIDGVISARLRSVGATELCTVLGDPAGMCVATVEHLLAALVGMGVDNARIEIDAAEVPVMDGSAQAFVDAIRRVGTATQRAPRRVLRVRRRVRVELGDSYAEFSPYEGCRFEVAIAYDCSVIGRQAIGFDLTPASFHREIARARTFGHLKDVERLWAAGFALGSSLENSVAIADGAVVNPDGLRYPDEFVRHKLLDAIGDLALAGAPIQGLYRSFKGGHRLNAMALDALLGQPDAWTMVSAAAEPSYRRESRTGLLSGLLAPAFASEIS